MKIAIINGVCLRADAISQSVYGTAVALTSELGAGCKIFSYACEFSDIDYQLVSSPAEIVNDTFFQSADVVIYHFGIFYELFNSIFLAPQNATVIVIYHNITPKVLVGRDDARLIDKSLAQRANITAAHEVWAVSEYNKNDLMDFGIEESKIVVVPLYVKFSERGVKPKRHPDSPIELLYVGRFVASKGISDLLDAIAALPSSTPAVRLRLVGNVNFSDKVFVTEIRNRIDTLGLGNTVIFEGKVDDETLKLRYIEADAFVMPSYHEGFCVPVIEAMHFGCVPIGYEAGNLGPLIGDFGLRVRTGDVVGLTNAVATVANDMRRARQYGKNSIVSWRGRKETLMDYHKSVEVYLKQFDFRQFREKIAMRLSKLRNNQ